MGRSPQADIPPMPTSLKTEKCLITVYIDFKNVIEKMNIREAY
jgi:hypothetical protein